MPRDIKQEFFRREAFSLIHAEVFARYGNAARGEDGNIRDGVPAGVQRLAQPLNIVRIEYTPREAIIKFQ